MKQILFLLLLILIYVPCIGQRKIKKLDVVEKGYNIKLNFEPINDKIIYNQLEIKITPVSADKLNTLFLEESSLNGKFEYSYYNNSRSSYFLKKNRNIQVKSDFDFIISGLVWLLGNEKISELEYEELMKRLILYYDKETGESLYNTDDNILSNPYYIINKYLSVFKIEFTNPTNSFVTFDKKIFLQSGNVIYSPLAKDFILEELQRSNMRNFDKSLILEKYNLHDTVLIPPHSNFVKFFAVTPINYDNNKLEILIPGIDKILSWSILKDEKIIDEKYTYYEFDINWSVGGTVLRYLDNFSILTNKHTSIFLGDNEMYIGENSLNEKFEVISLSFYGNAFYFGRNTDLKGIDYIDSEKGRRNPITILLEKIPDIKRK